MCHVQVEAAYGYGDEDAPLQEETFPEPDPSTAQTVHLGHSSAVPRDMPSQALDIAIGGDDISTSEALSTAHFASDGGAFGDQHAPSAATTFDGFAEDLTVPSEVEQHPAEAASANIFQPDSGGRQQRSAADSYGGVAANPGAELFAEDPAADLFSGEQDIGTDFFGTGPRPDDTAAKTAEVWQNPERENSLAGLFPPAAKAFGGGLAGDLSFLDNPLEDAEGDWGM